MQIDRSTRCYSRGMNVRSNKSRAILSLLPFASLFSSSKFVMGFVVETQQTPRPESTACPKDSKFSLFLFVFATSDHTRFVLLVCFFTKYRIARWLITSHCSDFNKCKELHFPNGSAEKKGKRVKKRKEKQEAAIGVKQL